jgi:hypothetical protein
MPEVLDQQALATALSALWWPLAAFGLALVYMKEISDLAKRLRGAAGATFGPPQPRVESSTAAVIGTDVADDTATAPPPPQATGADVATTAPPPPEATDTAIVADALRMRVPTSILWEQEIQASEPLRSTTNRDQRERLLLAFAGRLAMNGSFEQIEGSIWASQLRLLEHLNAGGSGHPSELKARFYDLAAQAFPSWFKDYSFEAYLGFLASSGLLQIRTEGVRFLQTGKDYLLWRVERGKGPKLIG